MVVATKQLGEEVRSEELGVGIARTPAHQRFIHPPRSSTTSLFQSVNPFESLGLGGENPLLTVQSATLPHYSRSEVLSPRFWRSHSGNDPINNLDPSGHDSQKTYKPPQEPPAQNPNAHVNAKTPTTQHGTTSSAERGILKQADSLGDAPSWAVPKAGEPLAGAGFGQAASGLQKMDQQEAHWLAAHHLSGPGGNTGPTVPPGARPTPYPGELSPAALQYRSPGDPNPPSYVQAIGGHLWYFPLNDKGTHTPALPPGTPPFAPPSYNGPLPPLHLPPGVNLIPGVKSFVQAKQDFNWQRYNKANQTFQLGLAAALVAVIGGVSARESDLTGLFRGSAKKAVGQIHHIMSNKNLISKAAGGPYTRQFEKLAAQRGISLEHSMNLMKLTGHQGPHPAYNAEVYGILNRATAGLKGQQYNRAFDKAMQVIRQETATPGTDLNKLATGH